MTHLAMIKNTTKPLEGLKVLLYQLFTTDEARQSSLKGRVTASGGEGVPWTEKRWTWFTVSCIVWKFWASGFKNCKLNCNASECRESKGKTFCFELMGREEILGKYSPSPLFDNHIIRWKGKNSTYKIDHKQNIFPKCNYIINFCNFYFFTYF